MPPVESDGRPGTRLTNQWLWICSRRCVFVSHLCFRKIVQSNALNSQGIVTLTLYRSRGTYCSLPGPREWTRNFNISDQVWGRAQAEPFVSPVVTLDITSSDPVGLRTSGLGEDSGFDATELYHRMLTQGENQDSYRCSYPSGQVANSRIGRVGTYGCPPAWVRFVRTSSSSKTSPNQMSD